MSTRISLRASVATLLAPNIAAFLVVEVVLFALTRAAPVLSLLAFGGLSLLCAAGFTAEHLAWRARGIRCIDLDEESMTVYRGPALVPEVLPLRMVNTVRVRSILGRRSVELLMLSGRRLRIHGDAFAPEPFEHFCSALRTPFPR